MKRLGLGIGLLLTAAATLSAQQHATIERGFNPEKVYQTGDVDNVNLLNGNLVLTIPIGPTYSVSGGLSYGLTLTYNSNLWDYEIGTMTSTTDYTRGVPGKYFNAGLGWTLSMGRLLGPRDALNDNNEYNYVGPDGSEHVFYSTLHHDDPETTPGVFYTRDNSYLRLREMPGSPTSRAVVDFPNGQTQTFETTGAQAWQLKRIADPYGNYVTVTYGASAWTIADSWGRTHTVRFQANGVYGQIVQQVDLAGFNGTRSVYNFSYAEPTLGPACPHNDFAVGAVPTPLLTGMTLPDNSQYAMPQADYEVPNPPPAAGGCTPDSGRIRGLTLPTGGRLEWAYTSHTLVAPGSASCFQGPKRPWLQVSRGVGTRTVRNGATVGTWTYGSSVENRPFDPVRNCTPTPREKRTTVTSPLGDQTVYFFSVAGPGEPGWLPQEFGLPLTRNATDGTRFLSVQSFDRNDANGAQELKRSAWVRYEMDQLAGIVADEERWHYNRRVASRRQRYDADGNKAADENDSDFDGLGHYRTQSLGGSFASGNTRTTTTQWNPAAGQYVPGSPELFHLPAPGGPWQLGIYSETQTTEGTTAKVQTCFNPTTGFLERKRTYASGTAAGANDLIALYSTDVRGNLASEQYFGGDGANLATSDVCGAYPFPANAYRLEHSYVHPDPSNPTAPVTIRETSFWANANGTPFSTFLTQDEERDRNTGLVRLRRDTAGLATSYEYDGLGRLTWEMPAANQDGWTEYAYTAPVGGVAAEVLIRQRANGSKSAAVQAQSRVIFDKLGRVFEERQLIPGGIWNRRQTLYDAMGHRASVSELKRDDLPADKKTEFLEYDAFDRPHRIRPADGSGHDVELIYAGVRKTTRVVPVGQSFNGSSVAESAVSSTETYDRQGRLVQVTEPSGESGTDVSTNYLYDVGNRLRQVQTMATVAGSSVTQTRSFSYDNRGFLLSETHPEKGAAGNGTVSYQNYDAMGHARRKLDGPNNLTYSWDRAGRLTQIRETGTGGRVLKAFTYGTDNGDLSNGKLVRESRFNYATIGVNPFTVEIRTGLGYLARMGRVAERTIENYVNGAATPSESFHQTFTYTVLGDVNDLGYPQCTHSPCAGTAASPRTVRHAYTEGFLTAVTGVSPAATYASSISYHPNLLVNQVAHGNSVIDTQANDGNALRRPASISAATAGGVQRWSSGGYVYDGAGNITKMGNAWFLYDKVSRLTTGTIFDGPTGAGTQKQQTYSFDPFGNLKAIGGTGGRNTPTAPAINRLNGTGVTYDSAGNLTNWNGNLYTWDAFNQMSRYKAGSDEWLYVYDAEDERVWSYKTDNTSRWTLRDLGNRVLREYVNNAGTWSVDADQIYRDGLLLASETPAGVRHYHLDHLGTPRLITNAAGQQAAYHVYFPFGEEATAFNQDAIRMKFTGHERDLANGGGAGDDLDYMHARFCSPVIGRFLGVDVGEAKPKLPQSWNRYSYALGNPMKYVDPDGKIIDTVLDIGFIGYDLFDIGRSALRGEGISKTQGLSLGADLLGAAIPFVTGGGAAIRLAARSDDVLHGVELARHLGEAGEAAVRAAVDIGDKTRFLVPGNGKAFRVADGFNSKTRVLTEVKNVKRLSLTAQLRDFIAIAKANNAKFVLYVRTDTKLAGTVLAAEDAGDIVIRYIPK
jgi:RHS repeat-associated protein